MTPDPGRPDERDPLGAEPFARVEAPEAEGPGVDEWDPVDTPLLEVAAALDDEGYAGQFRAVEGGRLQCLTCRSVVDASDVESAPGRRLEGASDPADEVLVIPLVCPVCATPGTFTAHYGSLAAADEADAVAALERRATPPPSSPPA